MKINHNIDGLSFTTEIQGRYTKREWIELCMTLLALGVALFTIYNLISLGMGLYALN